MSTEPEPVKPELISPDEHILVEQMIPQSELDQNKLREQVKPPHFIKALSPERRVKAGQMAK